jgi:predicted regulator of Ras-like GTPase activity (Roadblock/LC7/MglB family)
MSRLEAPPGDFFAGIDTEEPLDAAVLLKRNGQILAAWTRNAVPLDVITVMAATTLGSLETLMETLGAAAPQSFSVVGGDSRMLLQKVEPAAALLLVAPAKVSETYLRERARRLLAKLPPPLPNRAKPVVVNE